MSTGSSPLPDILDNPSVKPSNTNSIETAEIESTHSQEHPNDELDENSQNAEPELKSPEWHRKSGFGMSFGGSSTLPDIYDPQSVATINTNSIGTAELESTDSDEASETVDELETKQEHELAEEAADAEVEEIEENQVTFEDRMRNTLRTLGVEVEDDDDWKQMVIKTRLTLAELKDSFTSNKGSKEERTKKIIIKINDENVMEVQFRLDFSHWTPPNLDLDPDELEIQPDLTDLETPVNPEKPFDKRKRLKKVIKAIDIAHKLNKKRLKRLEKKRLKEEEDKKKEEEAEQTQQDGEDGQSQSGQDIQREGEKEGEEKVEGEVGDEDEEEDTRDMFDKIEDETGIRVTIKTDVLEERMHDNIVVPLTEYKDIFFGPEFTDEEKAELEKLANDDKDFYVHLKFLVRKKTWEEKEAERIAAEEEAKRKAALEAEEEVEEIVEEELIENLEIESEGETVISDDTPISDSKYFPLDHKWR